MRSTHSRAAAGRQCSSPLTSAPPLQGQEPVTSGLPLPLPPLAGGGLAGGAARSAWRAATCRPPRRCLAPRAEAVAAPYPGRATGWCRAGPAALDATPISAPSRNPDSMPSCVVARDGPGGPGSVHASASTLQQAGRDRSACRWTGKAHKLHRCRRWGAIPSTNPAAVRRAPPPETPSARRPILPIPVLHTSLVFAEGVVSMGQGAGRSSAAERSGNGERQASGQRSTDQSL